MNISSDHITIYPSSNASDSGRTNTEMNLAKITKDIVKNFALPAPDFSVSKQKDDNGKSVIRIKGDLVISGYHISLKKSDYLIPEDPSYNTIVIQLYRDSTGRIIGDGKDSEGNDVCYGAEVVFTNELYSEEDSLVLGTYKWEQSGDNKTVTFEEDPLLRCGINLSQIYYTSDSDSTRTSLKQYLETTVSQHLLNLEGSASKNITSQDIGTSLNFNGPQSQQVITFGSPSCRVGYDRSGYVIEGFKVWGAVWNDYAELYRREDPEHTIEPGSLIYKCRGKDLYSDKGDSCLVVGVCSDQYGQVLGGDPDVSLEENLKTHVPVALAGRVFVKIRPEDAVEEGDLLYATGMSYASSREIYCRKGSVIGKALESSRGDKEKILVQVFLA